MRARLTVTVGLALIGLTALGRAAVAQTKEEHEQHHPGGATGGSPLVAPPGVSSPPAPALTPAPAPGPTPPAAAPPPMDMERMMREMQRMMGGPPKRPPLSRLLDVERLTETERNALRGEAERRVQEGLQRIERGTRDLVEARRSRDDAAVARAVDALKDGLAEWETGQAVQQAFSSPAPRAAALRWFRTRMNLEVLSPPPAGPWGLSWRHAAVMAILLLAAGGAVGLYAYKIGRSLRLLARLSRDDQRS